MFPCFRKGEGVPGSSAIDHTTNALGGVHSQGPLGESAGVTVNFERATHQEPTTLGRTPAHPVQPGLAPSADDVAMSPCGGEILELQLSPEELAILQSFRDKASRLTILGQIPGPSPGYQKLKEWSFLTLHKSITACALVGNGYFEISFAQEEGVQHTLSHAFFYEGKEVPFVPWNADFSSENPEASTLMEHPVWLQFLGLGLPLRNETCLRILGGKYGKVLYFEDSASFLGRTAGPRVKVLVKDITKIRERVRLRGLSEGVFQEYKILVTGHPNQCAICHSLGHPSRVCPQNKKPPRTGSPLRPNRGSGRFPDQNGDRGPRPDSRVPPSAPREQGWRQVTRRGRDQHSNQDWREPDDIRRDWSRSRRAAGGQGVREQSRPRPRGTLPPAPVERPPAEEIPRDDLSSHTPDNPPPKNPDPRPPGNSSTSRRSGSFVDALFNKAARSKEKAIPSKDPSGQVTPSRSGDAQGGTPLKTPAPTGKPHGPVVSKSFMRDAPIPWEKRTTAPSISRETVTQPSAPAPQASLAPASVPITQEVERIPSTVEVPPTGELESVTPVTRPEDCPLELSSPLEFPPLQPARGGRNRSPVRQQKYPVRDNPNSNSSVLGFVSGVIEPRPLLKGPPTTPIKTTEPRPSQVSLKGQATSLASESSSPLPTKDQLSTPENSFIWKSVHPQTSKQATDPGMTATILPYQQKRGHRLSNIPGAFWEAVGLNPPSSSTVRRGRVFPILVSGSAKPDNTMDFRVLSDRSKGKRTSPMALRQITVLESQTSWSSEEARSHLVNESSLSLRKVILNSHNLKNPIKQWKNALWFYRWIEDGLGASHCVLMVFVPIIVPSELSLQKPERYRWDPTHDEIRNFVLGAAEMGDIVPIQDDMALMMNILLGDNLFDIEPSPPRPSQKKMKTSSASETEGHQPGCVPTDEEDGIQSSRCKDSDRITAE